MKNTTKRNKHIKAFADPTHKGVTHIRSDVDRELDVFLSLRAASEIVRMPRDVLRQKLRTADIGPAGWKGRSPVWTLTDIYEAAGPEAYRSADVEQWSPRERRAHYSAEKQKLALHRAAAGLIRAEDAAAASARLAALLLACIREAVTGLAKLGASAQMVAATEQHFSSVTDTLNEMRATGAG